MFLHQRELLSVWQPFSVSRGHAWFAFYLKVAAGVGLGSRERLHWLLIHDVLKFPVSKRNSKIHLPCETGITF